MREKNPNQTFTGLDAESHFEECASQYPQDPTTAGFVLGISTLLFWADIIILVAVAIGWIVRASILIER
jgi:hypothetical protein